MSTESAVRESNIPDGSEPVKALFDIFSEFSDTSHEKAFGGI